MTARQRNANAGETPALAAEQVVAEATEAVRRRVGGRTPTVAVVLGSGLGAFAGRVAAQVRIPYTEIPHFPPPTVAGHCGELAAGELGGKVVLVQSGRFHMYEGHSAQTVALPVRVFAALGVGTLVLTGAAGGIQRTFAPGTIMLLADHINLTFRNPLIGRVLPDEERFPDMSAAYDASLRALARDVAERKEIPLSEGVYAGLLGPSYETPAEIRMLERLGADAVGMSMVMEAIAARARGLRCLGFAAITNMAPGISPQPLSHDEVVATGARVQKQLGDLVEGVIGGLSP